VGLRCQQCDALIHPRDVDYEALEARCRRCGWAFGKIESPYRRGRATALAEREEEDVIKPGVPRPNNVEVREDGASTTIRYRAYSRADVIGWSLLVLCAVIASSAAAFAATSSLLGSAVIVTAVAVMLYGLLASVRYPRDLVLDAFELRVQIGPLTVARYPIGAITQLGVTDEVGLGHRIRYHLSARIEDVNVPLLTVARALDGLYLEQELERRLDLGEEPLPGEIFGVEDVEPDDA
jgi:hypothetical protein